MDTLSSLYGRLVTLDRPFAFLPALPFAVAIAGLTSHLVRQRTGRA
jgi:hypothetical protein